MKKLFDYCDQQRAYEHSYGKCLIELEENETIEDVKQKYVDVKRYDLEQKYSSAKEISTYEYGGNTYKGRLVIMDTFRYFLD